MRTVLENGTVTLFLEGRIDINNAPQTESEIFGALEGAPERVVIDAEKLEYISSAGLRVLMKLCKKLGSPVTMLNVSRDVYEILETTGFTELLDVQKALREISVEGCEIIGRGGNGIVYRLDEDKIVKLYFNQGPELVKQEQQFARTALINDIPTVIPYDTVRCGDKYGVVFELLRSDTLGHIISREPQRLDELTDQYVALARSLHSTHIKDGAVPDARDLMRGRAARLDRWCSQEEIDALLGIIGKIPACDTVIHGDLHPGNIMMQDGELLLIDLAEVTLGPKVFDLASIYRDMIVGARVNTELSQQSVGMPVDMIEKTGQLFFVKYTGITDPEELKAYFDKLGLIFAFNTVLLCGAGVRDAEARAQGIMDNLLRKVVLPNKDAIPYLFSVM